MDQEREKNNFEISIGNQPPLGKQGSIGLALLAFGWLMDTFHPLDLGLKATPEAGSKIVISEVKQPNFDFDNMSPDKRKEWLRGTRIIGYSSLDFPTEVCLVIDKGGSALAYSKPPNIADTPCSSLRQKMEKHFLIHGTKGMPNIGRSK